MSECEAGRAMWRVGVGRFNWQLATDTDNAPEWPRALAATKRAKRGRFSYNADPPTRFTHACIF